MGVSMTNYAETSHMRVSFAQFREAGKAVRETGNIMEAIYNLSHSLSSPILKIETPSLHLSKSEAVKKIRQGEYS